MGNCFCNKKSDHDTSSIYRPSVSTQHTNRESTSSNLSSHQRSRQNSQNPYVLPTQDNEILKRYLSNLPTVSESKPKPQNNIGQINLSTQNTNQKLTLSNLSSHQRSTEQSSQNRLNLQTQNNLILKQNLSTVSETKPKPRCNVDQINLSTQNTNQKLTLPNLGRDQRSIQSSQNRWNLPTQDNEILKRYLSNLPTVSESKPKPQNNIGQINLSTQNTNQKLTLSNLGRDQRSIQSSQNPLNLRTKNNQISKNRLSVSTTANSKPKLQGCVNQRNLSSQNSSKQQTKTFYASPNSRFSSDESRAQEEKSKQRDQFRQKPNLQREKKQLSAPILRLLKLVYNENSVILDDQKIAFHYYRILKTKLNLLNRHEPAYPKICNYLKNTHGPTHKFKLSIENIYSTYRWGVINDFKPKKKLGNLKLLWHGSELKNFPSILSNGLLTKPPSHVKTTGKMFGNGIYFADVVTKAAQYCKVDSSNPYGILILAQVALGEEYIRTKRDYITKLPCGKNSVKALGRYQPNNSESIRMFGMEIPIGKPTLQHYLTTSLQYNEYIVYDINQIFIEYLVLVKFNY